MAEPSAPVSNPNTDYERSDVPLRPIVLVAAGVLVILAAGPLALHYWAAFPNDAHRAPTLALPAPRLEVNGHAELEAFRAAERAKLNSYGWIDRKGGIAHIPIAEAMKRVVAEGIAGFPRSAP
jgi:hypothetical protein